MNTDQSIGFTVMNDRIEREWFYQYPSIAIYNHPDTVTGGGTT
jgi:hypothetical protein